MPMVCYKTIISIYWMRDMPTNNAFWKRHSNRTQNFCCPNVKYNRFSIIEFVELAVIKKGWDGIRLVWFNVIVI